MIKRVLIVDDSGVGRKLVRRCVEFAGLTGCEFVEAENGAVALDIIERGGIDLLITDLNMPVMDGFELLRALSSTPMAKDLATIVVSSASTAALEGQLAKFKLAAMIPKPVSPTALAKILAPLLANRAQA